MSNFDEFVKENFSALHESCENGNFIAKMTKDSMLAAWNEQQKKIDAVLNLVCKLQYSSGERIYQEVQELLK